MRNHRVASTEDTTQHLRAVHPGWVAQAVRYLLQRATPPRNVDRVDGRARCLPRLVRHQPVRGRWVEELREDLRDRNRMRRRATLHDLTRRERDVHRTVHMARTVQADAVP